MEERLLHFDLPDHIGLCDPRQAHEEAQPSAQPSLPIIVVADPPSLTARRCMCHSYQVPGLDRCKIPKNKTQAQEVEQLDPAKSHPLGQVQAQGELGRLEKHLQTAKHPSHRTWIGWLAGCLAGGLARYHTTSPLLLLPTSSPHLTILTHPTPSGRCRCLICCCCLSYEERLVSLLRRIHIQLSTIINCASQKFIYST